MGCASSTQVPDPNEMYANGSPYDKKQSAGLNGNTNNNTTQLPVGTPRGRLSPIPNGTSNDTGSKNSLNSAKSIKDSNNRTLKGDLTHRSEAKREREKKLHERQRAREKEALLVSDKAMEDKEMLSLVSSRSRATSRTGSPKTHKVSPLVNTSPPCSPEETTSTPNHQSTPTQDSPQQDKPDVAELDVAKPDVAKPDVAKPDGGTSSRLATAENTQL